MNSVRQQFHYETGGTDDAAYMRWLEKQVASSLNNGVLDINEFQPEPNEMIWITFGNASHLSKYLTGNKAVTVKGVEMEFTRWMFRNHGDNLIKYFSEPYD